MTSTIVFEDSKLKDLSLPRKRAAYSDRTALIMATLCDIAYSNFDKKPKSNDSNNSISLENKNSETNLRSDLEDIGFELIGEPIIETVTDTQAFVAIRKRKSIAEFAVICFRGTKGIRDWLITNFDISTVPIKHPHDDKDYEIGYMHQGFHKAYKSVEELINLRLKEIEELNLPVYVTGHSMGGAKAVVATWYQSKHKLAACYTFGAPKVGDIGSLGWFRTPIYRIVNGADPIPSLPKSSKTLNLAKNVGWKIINFVRKDKTLPFKGYIHYSNMKYIPILDNQDDLRIFTEVNFIVSLINHAWIKLNKLNLFDEYHSRKKYKKKLKKIAENRNPLYGGKVD